MPYNDDVQIVEGNNYNSSSDCNNCHKTIYWNACCIHRRTKRKVPLDFPYKDGELPSRHLCMKTRRPGVWLNKYDSSGKPTTYTNYMALFLEKCVIWEKDNLVMVAAKRKLQEKLVGWDGHTTYVERCKL